MMRDSSSVRLTWSVGSGPSTGGWGGLPPGFLPVASIFASRASIFASMLGLLPLEPFLRPCLDRCAGRRKLLQPYAFAPLQFLRYRHAVGDIRLIRRLGLRQQVGHFRFKLRLDLSCVLIGQCAVAAGIGVDLGPSPAPPCPSSSTPISRASNSTLTEAAPRSP